MKTLTAIALAIAIASPAHAESIPKYFTGTLSMSCVPVKIDKNDKDRILWTDVKAIFENWEMTDISIEHHGVSGKSYFRADQYTVIPGQVFGRPEGETDALWIAPLLNKKDKRHVMVAGIHDDKFGSWHYAEDHFFGKNSQGRLVDEICHDASFEPASEE